MNILKWLVGTLLVICLFLYAAGRGWITEQWHAGSPQSPAIPAELVEKRENAIEKAATDVGVQDPKQILFGDLHVHTTFSFDAFQMSLPMAGGDGAHPVADACDFARHCAGLDFWSINDHAVTLTPRRWEETVESVRQCNNVAGDGSNPDLVSYLGWEWTQVGTTPETHWGHKNVILRDLADDQIPSRPISAGIPPGLPEAAEIAPNPVLLGGFAVYEAETGGPDFATYMAETLELQDCPQGVPVRDMPMDCREIAPTPADLFAKLDDWDKEAMVIPHGTTWGFYTPLGSSWDKQLTPDQHDPKWQSVVEVFSGHGNSEEYRPLREAILAPDGSWSCPAPAKNFMPSCWRAGQIIQERCVAEKIPAGECAERAAEARQNFIDAAFNGGFSTVPGTKLSDWGDAGQCRDCFQPSFNYRPKSSVQYMMALGRPDQENDRFRFGFIAASDNHSARPGTGYKEFSRKEFTEARFGNFVDTQLGQRDTRDPLPKSERVELSNIITPFANFETERGASFFLTGGLAAVHADGRDRKAIWDAMQRREIYGTSGPRILLWFDLMNGPNGETTPMGSAVEMTDTPLFRARAVGSFEPKAGCPIESRESMNEARLARLCQGECYYPSDVRRPITRIEVVRIQPQTSPNENVDDLIEDPWKVLPCTGGADGCEVTFTDDEFRSSGRDTLYYVRAIEAPSQVVDADPLGCTRDAKGRCVEVSPCFSKPWTDDCLSESEERAWSSPIFVDQGPAAAPAHVTDALPIPDRDQIIGVRQGSDGA
ncbi:MAG: DUF3604 domain-containing protein [Candidatus Binatia bacterium]|nr:DUF3604 domain-containing protein [Candidatus Binatia bacterium]